MALSTKTKPWLSLPVLGLLLLGLNGVRADTLTLTSVADADIEEFHPNNNNGSATSMASGELGSTSGNEIRRALLRFDLTGQLPPGATINSVSLNVVVTRTPPTFAPFSFDLRRLLEPWSESAVTWNSRLAATPWQQPGAEGAADSAPTASASVFISGVGPYTFATAPGLMNDIQAWLNDPTSNNGWLLVSEGEGTPYSAARFATREDPVNAPTLTIDYSPPLPVILTQPQSQAVQVNGIATFSVIASGPPPLTYQWLFFGNPMPDATNDTLVLSQVQTNDAGDYSVVVSNPNGSTNSQTATLTVSPLPVPVVSFLTPTNGTRLPAQSQLLITAQASESNGLISQIEILLDGSSLGLSTNNPFSVVLTNPVPGTHILTATALDQFGAVGSNSVSFSVLPSASVALVQPAQGASFPLGTNITLTAVLAPGGPEVTNVLFLANGALIGQTSSPPFSILWQPTVAQTYALSAVALDEFGLSATSSVVSVRIFISDSTPPGVRITESPPNFARLTSPTAALAGTAHDNVGLDHVEFQVNDGLFQPAVGTSSWQAVVPLHAGLNIVRVRSVDLAGNTSALATRFLTFVVTAPLTLEANGAGTILPDLNGRLLEIGKVYHLSARPAPGNLFAGWTGASNSNSPSLNFQMSSNLTLTARFVPNPFPAVAGTYTGLFLDTNHPAPESAGLLSLRVDGQGAFSGNLAMNGPRYPFHGRFSAAGGATLPVLRPTHTPVVLALQLDLGPGADTLSGFATNAIATNTVASPLLARREVFSAVQPAPQQGFRGFALQESAPEPGAVFATGLAIIRATGLVRFAVVLSDGTPFLLSSALAGDGSAPFYLPLPASSGMVIGQLLFPPPPAAGPSGSLFWVVSGTNGFTRLLTAKP